MTNKITVEEMRELLKREEVPPSKVFSKEDFIKDEKLMSAMKDKMDLEDFRAGKNPDKVKNDKSDNPLIPDDDIPKLTPEEKKKQDKDNEFIPDSSKDDDNDLIPD